MDSRTESTLTQSSPTPETVAALTMANGQLRGEIVALKHQLDWFKRQLFGQKSERHPMQPNGVQMNLGELFGAGVTPPPEATKDIAAHTRRQKAKPASRKTSPMVSGMGR